MSYVLLIYIYAGVFAKGDNVALHSVGGFPTMQACESAGRSSASLTNNSYKEFRFKCYEVKEPK